MDVNVGHLLIGGAVTGIVLGLAAQPVLGNLFAGLVLLFSRPYVPGERIRVLAGSINGPHEGVVVSTGMLYTTLLTSDGPLIIPNSALLGAAVGPAAEPTAADNGPVTDPAGHTEILGPAVNGHVAATSSPNGHRGRAGPADEGALVPPRSGT